MVLELGNSAGSSITNTIEPGRPLNLTCVSDGEYAGSVMWMLAGNNEDFAEITCLLIKLFFQMEAQCLHKRRRGEFLIETCWFP